MSIRLPGYSDTVQCPYDKSHIILTHRFQTHLIKCSRSHPEMPMEICPFDQTHHIPKEKLDDHVKLCPSRGIFDLHLYDVNGGRETVAPPPKPSTSKKQDASGEEDWDHYDCGTYDPKQNAEQKKVIRSAGLSTKSERRQFRDEERKRLSALEKEKK